MSAQQLDHNAVAQAFAAQFLAQFSAQVALVEAQAQPRPQLNAMQHAICDAVEAGVAGYARIGRKVGMTQRQTEAMARGMLFAGVLVSRGGRLSVA